MWQGIRGHDDIVEAFRRSLQCGRLASTYLFVGPEGVGKRSFARQLAAALLCTETPDEQLASCGQCESCRLFAAGNHPDLDELARPAGKRSLPIELFVGDRDHRNQVGLCHNIALRPLLGRRRAAIIDDADWLTVESANSLLKTLEEPPPGALIVLVGTSRSRQLPTILSRAQIVRFGPLAREDVVEIALEQGTTADREAAVRLAELAGGSLQAARELADPELGTMRDRFVAHLAGERFDLPRVCNELAEFVNSAGKEAEAKRARLRRFFALAVDSWRVDLRGRLADGAAVEFALAAMDRTLTAAEQLDRNANQSTLLECWIADLARLR
ncbi:MAG: DNA polymerase III subunit delta' [Planctomycetales bacterium]|nr:DNA polymerase III subunit delta' [Planctomycetales bacterium]